MTQKEILEGNELIAKFMGYRKGSISRVNFSMTNDEGRRVRIESMKYHSSWDWLMPVISKILGIEFTMPKFNVTMVDAQEKFYSLVYRGLYYRKTEEVFGYVVTFLKIYETNK